MNPEDIRQLVQARIGQAVESLEDAKLCSRQDGVGGLLLTVLTTRYSMACWLCCRRSTVSRANTRAPLVSLIANLSTKVS